MKSFNLVSFALFLPQFSLISGLLSESLDRGQNSVHRLSERNFESTSISDISLPGDCGSCETLLGLLKTLAYSGDENFVNVITQFCVSQNIEDPDVCQGAIALDGPILAHDLRGMSIPSTTSQHFCITIFGQCSWPPITPYSVTMTPKLSNASRPSPSGMRPLQVVHISDIHVDLSYVVGASSTCSKNICCRPYTQADAPGHNGNPAGKFGEPDCDSPIALEESLYAAVESLVPDRNFIIFTGDIVEGAVWNISDTEVGNDIDNAYTLMQGLKSTVYGVVGNHDTCPVNSFPPPAVDTTISSQWAYSNISSSLEAWIGTAAAAEVENNYGSYSVRDSCGVRVISINTNFWYKENFWLYEETMESDPAGLLAWLVTELEAAETAGERVWLIGHIPLGSSDSFHDQSSYFDQIIQRFDATIAAVFFGHTHKDEFEIAYSNYTNQAANTATMVGYIAPALTPTSGNPTFRVYSVDPTTFAILDYSTYFANMSDPTYQTNPTWSLLYSVKETYGSLVNPPVTDASAELTPAFWHSLTELFESDDDIFQDYYGRKSRDYNASTCTGSCKTAEICQLRSMQSQYNCAPVTPGVNFKRDAGAIGHGRGHTRECEGSAAVGIFSQLGVSGRKALSVAIEKHLGQSF